ncbi:MAG: hypothetical protein LBU53_12510 [Zoogloeaceae bacterium]|jgi:hypothetical protein|nr:hypothetical protein [Zoogloeaceae bacterium]
MTIEWGEEEATARAIRETEPHVTNKRTDNLIRDYQGTRYRYDQRGKPDRKNRPDRHDPLGRRIAKHSQPLVFHRWQDGSQYHKLEANGPATADI